jgi:hypothetical protein
MEAALEALRRFGYCDALLWVLEGNERAQRFYAGGGWDADGATKRDEHLGFPMDEVRYRIDLQDP